MDKSLLSYSKCPALRLSGPQVVARGAAPDWPSGQAARCRMTATQAQPEGPDLPAFLLSYISTYAPSLLLGWRANDFRCGVLGI